MKLLAIDTTEAACSAALWIDGGINHRFELAPRRHSELILPMMESLLAEADLSPTGLDGLAFSSGPGSFTGIRIATGVVQGVALAADLPVAPVSTLTALAQGAARLYNATAVLAALDARMGEVYWSACRLAGDIMRPVAKEHVCRPDQVEPPPGDWLGVGSGWKTYSELLGNRCSTGSELQHGEQQLHARDVALLGAELLSQGKGVPAEQALPVYLRDKVAAKAK